MDLKTRRDGGDCAGEERVGDGEEEEDDASLLRRRTRGTMSALSEDGECIISLIMH